MIPDGLAWSLLEIQSVYEIMEDISQETKDKIKSAEQ